MVGFGVELFVFFVVQCKADIKIQIEKMFFLLQFCMIYLQEASMFRLRGLSLLFSLLIVALFLAPAGAEELNKSFSHSLGIGNQAQSYEHRIDLPSELAAAGRFFIGRSLKLDGKLVIEREELTRTSYYVRVRLPKATLWLAKGSIAITLKAEKTDAPPPTFAAPADLKVSGGYYPRFSWSGTGNYSAISLLDRSSGKTLWERIVLNSSKCDLDEGSVRINGRYTWAVKNTDECCHYSPEAQSHFRVDGKKERCRQCFGQGYITCRYCRGSGHVVVNGPNNTPVTQICRDCNGTGRERCPDCTGLGYIIVPEIIQENVSLSAEGETDQSRNILNGSISAIELYAGENNHLQGKITISCGSTEQTFLVSRFTLILIKIDDKLRVSELRYLKPGWKCELAYDVPEDDSSDNMDLTAKLNGENGMKYADNMIIHYEP